MGTTARMRIDNIVNILGDPDIVIIDINEPVSKVNRIWKSLGFRFQVGLLIKFVNEYISSEISSTDAFDLAWIDKNIYINEKNIKRVRSISKKMIHYTPDCAFYMNRSRFFLRSLKYFDYLITTKSFELTYYQKYVEKDKVILTIQGYDNNIHKPHFTFDQKDEGLIFIGLHEMHRERLIQTLIDNGVKVKLAGKKWKYFVRKNDHNKNLIYLGDVLKGDTYASAISSSLFGLGLLSKKFPELHTTRTVEIPACETALLTERTVDTENMFKDDEVIFYSDTPDLMNKINELIDDYDTLKRVIKSGKERCLRSGYDYRSILSEILEKVKNIN